MYAAPFATVARAASMAFFAAPAVADGNDEIKEVRDPFDRNGGRSTMQECGAR